ncbi:MAG: molybdenum cofactor guanylyltransferase [Candidatus Acidiferrales bacterium]
MTNRELVGGFILAGGRSSRMGRTKGLLAFGGEPLVMHVARLLEFTGEPGVTPIIIGPPEVYANLGIRVVPDDSENLGPLGGISTALRIATCEWNLIVGCDLPFLTREWLEFLIAQTVESSADVVMALNERGFEPLCAMYRKSARPAIAEALERGVRKITDGLATLTLASIALAEWKAFDPCGRLFKNVNTPEDYDEARERLGEKAAS